MKVKKPALSTKKFRLSDRLTQAAANDRGWLGASCNTFICGDSCASLGEMLEWALHVSHQQGAPSVDFSALRPRGAAIASGGVSGGVVPFCHMLDSLVHNIRRSSYKKGAGIAWLDWRHADLQEFLEAPFNSIYRGVYIPGNHEPQAQQEFLASPVSDQLVAAFEQGKCFVCKTPAPGLGGERLVRNLCTEVEIPHRGFCLLGVVNLAQFDYDSLPFLPGVFSEAAHAMMRQTEAALRRAAASPVLFCNSANNKQFGLGVSGLASLLATLGVTYEAFTEALEAVVAEESLGAALHVARNTATQNYSAPLHLLVYKLVEAYLSATLALNGRVVKAFCVQPSATGAYECADVQGFTSSPELQPVTGLRYKRGVVALRKSQLKGDLEVTFAPACETTTEVPYALYARLCNAWQRLMNLTGLAHSHSASYYGKEFTKEALEEFVEGSRCNLYYRLPQVNEGALRKSKVGDGLAAEPASLDELLGGSCGLQQPGDSDCGCSG